jgi:predicted GNAT family acetyltransferase
MLATSGLEEVAGAEFVARWLEEDPDLPGVNGLPETAREIAAAWSEQTGGRSRCHMREAMHVLEEVRDPPRPADGELRLPGPDERELLVCWMNAFVSDAGVVSRGEAEVMTDLRLAREALLVWDHHGPVSMVGTAGPVGGVARIGPVYTPREHRSRGYASSAVAATSRRELARGARACMLFTDLANPISNKIYAQVGYRRFADWEEHVFERAEQGA